MKLNIKKASTSQTVYVFIQDSSLTTGAGKTGLAYNTGSLVAYYVRPLAAAAAITLATQTATGAWSSGGFVEVDSTNMPGVYRLDLPDAVLATGVNSVVVMLKGAANMAPVLMEIQLVSTDPNDAVRMGLTALPNAAAEASGGLFTRGTGAGQINQDANGRINVNLVAILNTLLTETAGQIAAGFKKVFDVGSPVFTAASVNQTGDNYARLGAPAGASVSADVAALPTAASIATAVWAAGTRSLTTFGTLVADTVTAVWAAVARTLTDKTGFALTSPYDPAKTASQAGDAMALTSGERTSIATAVWASATRSLTTFGTLVADVATAVWGATTRTLSAFGFTVTTDVSSTVTTNLDAAVSTRLATAGYTAPNNSGITSAASSAASAAADAATLITRLTSTRAGNLDNLDAAITTRLAPGGTLALVSTVTSLTNPATLAAAYDPAKTAAQVADIPTANQNADALLKRDWTAVTGEAARSALNALRSLRNKTSISAGTLTVCGEDDSTAKWTAAVSTDAAADPIVSVDPA